MIECSKVPNVQLIALLIAGFSSVCALHAPNVHAQQVGAAPNLQLVSIRNASTRDAVAAADGTLFVAGGFVSANLHQSELVRILPNGTLDTSFAVRTDGSLNGVALDGSGRIYVTGFFTEINGTPAQSPARLLATGNVDPSWSVPVGSSASGPVRVDSSGRVYAGVRRFATSGAVDAAWPAFNNTFIRAVELDSSGNVYYAGAFTSVGGQVRNGIVRIDSTGAVSSWAPVVTGSVLTIAVDASGVYLGGQFSAVNGSNRQNLAKLSTTDAALIPGFSATADSTVQSLIVSDTRLLIAGDFVSQVNGQSRARLAEVDTTTGAVSAWSPLVTQVNTLGGQNLKLTRRGSQAVLLGRFDRIGSVSPVTRRALAVFDAGSSAPLTTPNFEGPGTVFAITTTADGGYLVGGDFDLSNPAGRGVLRLNAQLEREALPLSINGTVFSIKQSAGGDLFIGGSFPSIVAGTQTVTRNNIVRFDANGQLNQTWNPALNGAVRDILVTSDGVVAGGDFSIFSGPTPRGGVIKLNTTTGAIIPEFVTSTRAVYSLHSDSRGIYAGGFFDGVNGASRQGIVRLNSTTGAIDPSWTTQIGCSNSGVCGNPGVIRIRGAGNQIYFSGIFDQINGTTQRVIARVDDTIGVLDNWSPVSAVFGRTEGLDFSIGPGNFLDMGLFGSANFGATSAASFARVDLTSGALQADFRPEINSFVYAILRQGSTLLIGGAFTRVQSQSRLGLAALREPLPEQVFRSGFEP